MRGSLGSRIYRSSESGQKWILENVPWKVNSEMPASDQSKCWFLRCGNPTHILKMFLVTAVKLMSKLLIYSSKFTPAGLNALYILDYILLV